MANRTYRNVGVTPKRTPQTKAIPGREAEMKANDAGGVVFDVGIWTQLERFLVLGTTGGTYYLNEKQHTIRNFEGLETCLKIDDKKTIDMIVDVSWNGRAMKQDQAIFALAVACSTNNTYTTWYALRQLSKVCRTASHLMMFVDFINERRSWGRAVRRAVTEWYLQKDIKSAAYQMAKYQERNGWSHKDILRSSHPNARKHPAHNALFAWAVGKEPDWDLLKGTMVEAYEEMKISVDVGTIVDLIKTFNAPWEIIPTEFRTNPEVWEALLPTQPMTAMMRNLANMTRYGVFKKKLNVQIVIDKLNDEKALQKARMHPLNVLVASLTYNGGIGLRSDNIWEPHRDISYALEKAFYKSFKYAPSTGKRIMYGLDLSGSMWWNKVISGLLTPAQVSACMSMALIEAEEGSAVYGFDTSMFNLDRIIYPGARLEKVDRELGSVGGGGTDCAMPMVYAKSHNLMFDAFVLFTDNQTWAGGIQPSQALVEYRKSSGIKDAKLCVVAMEANDFGIADPKDPNMLDVVGASVDLPALLQNFIGGKQGSADIED